MREELFGLKNGGGHGGGGMPGGLVEGLESLACNVLFDIEREFDSFGDDTFGIIEELEALDSTRDDRDEEWEGRKFTRGGGKGGGGGGGGGGMEEPAVLCSSTCSSLL